MRPERQLLPLLLGLAVIAGCRQQPKPVPVTPKPAPAAAPQEPVVRVMGRMDRPAPGRPVSGFYTTWGKPLPRLLAAHRKRHRGRCRRALAVTVYKSQRRLVVSCDGEPVKGYFVALGRSPRGDKQRRGDNRTPEGTYYLWGKNPRSRYYRALGVSYPNPEDARLGVRRGLVSENVRRRVVKATQKRAKPPQNTRLGGDIMLHGGGIGQVVRQGGRKYVRVRDWTAGCVALRNSDIAELFRTLPSGTRIRILP